MASFLCALDRVKTDPHDLLSDELIEGVCRSEGHAWRERLLGPAATVRLMLLQALWCNQPAAGLSPAEGLCFTDAAFAQARGRLPVDALRTLLRWTAARAAPASIQRIDPDWLWRGHRVVLIDGSGFSMPDTPELQQRFGQPGNQSPGCGFPVAHALALFDHATGMVLDLSLFPLRTHDAAAAPTVHRLLTPGDVLVGDRAFCSYAQLAGLQKQGVSTLTRMHQRRFTGFVPTPGNTSGGKRWVKGQPRSRWIATLGDQDQLVEWFRPAPHNKPDWMSDRDFRALPDSMVVRELRYRVEHPGLRTHIVTLATTLTDPVKYPKADLADLYRQRWLVETNLRHLKQTLKMDVLRCKSHDALEKTTLAFAIAYNLVCLVMMQAARQRGVRPARVSFVHALRWLTRDTDPDALARLALNRLRPGRVQPRAVKRRPKRTTC